MSHTKRALDDAAELLGVPVDELTTYVLNDGSVSTRPPRRFPPHGLVDVDDDRIYRAARALDIHPQDLRAWMRARERRPGDPAAVVAEGLSERRVPRFATMPATRRAVVWTVAQKLGVPASDLLDWLKREGRYTNAPNPPRPYPSARHPENEDEYMRAARVLDVHPDDLTRHLSSLTLDVLEREGKRQDAPGDVAAVPTFAVVGPATVKVPKGVTLHPRIEGPGGSAIDVSTHDTESLRLGIYTHTLPNVVSEDDYRGVAADLIAQAKAGQRGPRQVLEDLDLAAAGQPVTTPSRQALAAVREVLDDREKRAGGLRGGWARLDAILRQVGA